MSHQGSSDFIASGTVLVYSRWARDPLAGVRFEQGYEGTAAGISALGLTLLASGASVQYDQVQPGKKTLRASWGRDPSEPESAEVPVDRWELEMAPYQISLFRHPAAIAEAEVYIAPAQYRKDIQDAITEGEAYPLSTSSYPVGLQIYRLLAQGTEYWETQRPILRRQRTYSPSFATRVVLSNTSTVYLRSTIISTFTPPTDFQAQIPDDPTDTPPSGMVWGWRLVQRSFGYLASSRVFEEQTSWEGAYWSTSLYDFL